VRDSFTDYKYPKPFRILLVYIFTPLVIIYALILLAYFIKILVLWQIPNNLIVNLVIWFASFSVVYLFFLSRVDSIGFINKFKIIFPISLFPLLGMMFFCNLPKNWGIWTYRKQIHCISCRTLGIFILNLLYFL